MPSGTLPNHKESICPHLIHIGITRNESKYICIRLPSYIRFIVFFSSPLEYVFMICGSMAFCTFCENDSTDVLTCVAMEKMPFMTTPKFIFNNMLNPCENSNTNIPSSSEYPVNFPISTIRLLSIINLYLDSLNLCLQYS